MRPGFARVPSPAPGSVGGTVRPARPSSPPCRGRGACPVPGGDWSSGERCRSVPELGEASPGFGSRSA